MNHWVERLSRCYSEVEAGSRTHEEFRAMWSAAPEWARGEFQRKRTARRGALVAHCPGCETGLHFAPPRGQEALRILCPVCAQVSEFAQCWTCPRVILYDSVCQHCLVADLNGGIEEEEEEEQQQGEEEEERKPKALAAPEEEREAPGRRSPLLRGSDKKGMTNRVGQNACFLNVVLQSCWHLRLSFREPFEAWHLVHPSHCTCLYCSLKLILTNYRFSDADSVSPDAMQQSLSVLYAEESRFKVGEMWDASECFDAILRGLHEVAEVEPCVVHRGFSTRYQTQRRCACGWEGDVREEDMFIHYAYAAELSQGTQRFSKNLGAHNKEASASCERCGQRAPARKVLLDTPVCFSLGLVWSNPEDTPLEEIDALLKRIDTDLDLEQVFEQKRRKGFRKRSLHGLIGMVTYFGRHYAAYFRDQQGVWFSYDDTSVTRVGTKWQHVCERCLRGHAKPTLLFFEEKRPKKLATFG